MKRLLKRGESTWRELGLGLLIFSIALILLPRADLRADEVAPPMLLSEAAAVEIRALEFDAAAAGARIAIQAGDPRAIPESW